MKRLIYNSLIIWKDRLRRKPLIVRGARQVGKTFTIEQFGKENFENFVRIDFERNRSMRQIFEADLDPVRICKDLEIVLNVKIHPNKTLVFFDEIQDCPNAIEALRYFYEEMPELHIIAAGSLLEFALRSFSFPVGRVQLLNMFPMTFFEFLHGIGHSEAAETIAQTPRKCSETVHHFLLKQLHTYFFVGGMPECVATYASTKSIKEVQEVQSEIINTFRMDFPKYEPQTDRHCLDTVFTSLAAGVGKQIKYAQLAKNYSNPTIKKAFDTLQLARLVYKVASVNPPQIPLGASVTDKIFKSVFLDIGLMQLLCGMNTGNEYLKTDLLAIYNGALAEQFVGQELLAAHDFELYFWSRQSKSSLAEVDYVSVIQNNVIPIEVKSGAAGHLRSMHSFLEHYPQSPYGIVLSDREYAELKEQKLKFFPIYFTNSLANQ